jgi:uncharacterized membrane protein YphA (DoxX/SURF4 family)
VTRIQGFFISFPGSWPGIALFLLRTVLGLAIFYQGRLQLGVAEVTLFGWIVGLAALLAGGLLVIGFLTPIAGVLAVLVGVGIRLWGSPSSSGNLFASSLVILFAAAMLQAIVILGPGAMSVDARIFGRREIIIPPPVKRPS